MSDDRSTFETTRARLEDIVVQVRRKDVSLEQSLDMLEEAVRLVNQCNDLIDQTSFRAPAAPEEGVEATAATGTTEPAETPDARESADAAGSEEPEGTPAEDASVDGGEDASVEVVAVVETFELIDMDGADLEFVEFVETSAGTGDVQAPVEIEDDDRS